MNKNESGYTLIGVLTIFTIASVLAMSLVMLSVSTLKTSKTEVDNQSVFYIAEAGLNNAVNEIEKNVYEIAEDINTEDAFYNELDKRKQEIETFANNTAFTLINNVTPIVNVIIEHSKKGEYKVKSRGTIGSQSREVQQVMNIGWNETEEDKENDNSKGDTFGKFAVYAFGEMNFINIPFKDPSAKIGTNSTKSGSINLDQDTINQMHTIFYYPKEASDNIFVKKPATIRGMNPLLPPPLPEFPNLPTYSTEDKDKLSKVIQGAHVSYSSNDYLYFSNTDIISSTVTFNTQNDKVDSFFDSIYMSGAHIYMEGNGQLNLYINDSLDMDGSSITVKGNGKLNLYVNGSINLDESKIIANNEQVVIQSLGDMKLRGSEILPHPNFNSVYVKGDIKLEDSNAYSSMYAKGDIHAIKTKQDKETGNIYGNFYSERDILLDKISTHRPQHSNVNGSFFYAPNGELTVRNSDTIVGSLFSNKLNMDSIKLIYRNPQFKGPLSTDYLDSINNENNENTENNKTTIGQPDIKNESLHEID